MGTHRLHRDKGASALKKRGIAGISAIALLIAGCASEPPTTSPAPAPSPAPSPESPSTTEPETGFFDGATIQIMVPAGPGGGSDNAARLVANILPKYLEGNVSVQVYNEDGAGAQIPVNQWVARPSDGFDMVVISPSSIIPWLLGESLVEYEPGEMHLVWAQPAGRAVVAATSTGITSPRDFLNPAEPLFSGGRAPGSADMLMVLGLEVLQLRGIVQQIWGYSGGGATRTALEQGELNIDDTQPGRLLGADSYLLEDGLVEIIYTHGNVSGGQIGPDTLLPEIPTIRDAYIELYGSEPSGPAWEAFLAVTELISSAQWSIYMHPDTPANAVAEMRAAIEAAVQDAEYVDLAPNVLGPESPIVGDGIPNYERTLREIDSSMLSWLREFMRVEFELDGLGS